MFKYELKGEKFYAEFLLKLIVIADFCCLGPKWEEEKKSGRFEDKS